MASTTVTSRLDFVLHVTHYFNGHWEDPEWGRRAPNQVLIALAIRDLSEGITDEAVRKALLDAADKAINANSPGVRRA